MTSPRKKALAIAAALLVVAALIGAGATRVTRGPAVEAYTVARGALVQTVVASGRVESPRRVEIGSPIVGTVIRVPVEEGERVKAGQLLVALDDAEARAAVDQARYALAQAQAKLTQIDATGRPLAAETLRQAEVNLANAERSLARSKELLARGFIGQAALEDVQKGRDVAESQWKSARLQLESASRGGSDRLLAQAAASQAAANLRAAQAKLEQLTIEAPVDGTLIARNVEQGAVVQSGRALMVLSPAGATQLVVQIDEKNLNLLKVGEEALASADAYPGERFAARVAYINPAVDPLRGSVEVKLSVSDPPAYLLQDMTVSVDVEVARREGVLLLPVDGIHEAAGAAPWVYVVRDGRVAKQPVTLGARGDGRVEVVSGLAEGERAIPSTQVGLREGETVRLAAAKPARKT